MENIISSFLMRHQHPVSMTLHIIGIPLTILGVFELFRKKWKSALIYIFAGYLLQYLGHLLFEHNQMGEWVLITDLVKKIAG